MALRALSRHVSDRLTREAFCRKSVLRKFWLSRVYSTPTAGSGFKTTSPSSAKPEMKDGRKRANLDQGYLTFTKSSLYKLTLPLTPPSPSSSSPASEPSSETVRDYRSDESSSITERLDRDINENTQGNKEGWEQRVENGNKPVSQSRRETADELEKHSTDEPAHSVIFLLHSGQPLSYIANLVRAEGPQANPEPNSTPPSSTQTKRPNSPDDPTGDPPITFHTESRSGRRWSPSTGIGDFLREAARVGSFAIRIGSRTVAVNVPSFEERTRFLRASLHAKTRHIDSLARLKAECDGLAHRSTQKVAFAGAGIMGVWWVTVGVLTFSTNLGWDTMEPITYLTGLGTVISGYLWFLWHNREVSYRTVLTETTSRRQQKLYAERGFNIEIYNELIDDAKALRKAIKRVAWDYELTWDQGDTEAGQKHQKALDIVRKEEAKEKRAQRTSREEDDDDDEDEAFAGIDDDGDGKPDHRSIEEDEVKELHTNSPRKG